MAFQKKAKKRFHGLAMYVAEHLCESVLRIPDEDDELEIITEQIQENFGYDTRIINKMKKKTSP